MDYLNFSARLTRLAAMDFCRAGSHGDPQGGEDISGDLEAAADIIHNYAFQEPLMIANRIKLLELENIIVKLNKRIEEDTKRTIHRE